MQLEVMETASHELREPFDQSRLWERVADALEDFDEVEGVWELARSVLMLQGRRAGESATLFEIYFDYTWAQPLFCPYPRHIERLMALRNDGIINLWFGFELLTREQTLQTAHALLDPCGERAWLSEPHDVTAWFTPRAKGWWEED